MRWQGRRGSGNIEDQRSLGPRTIGVGGGAIGLVVIVLYLCLGGDPAALLQQAQNQPGGPGGGIVVGPEGGAPGEIDPAEEELAQFVSVVLADTEDVWHDIFQEAGSTYREPKLRLFRMQTESACGQGSAATGPFYCPADEKVYIDLSFFDEMDRKLNAPGDAAQAYVIAHEVGHHVQKLMGISDQVHSKQQQVGEVAGNELSVRLELQADFLAGVWAHHAERKWKVLEEGDLDEVMNAAAAIGDDRLQKRSQGYVVPESFSHGTSKQRARWFVKGLKSGRVADGDTFSIDYSEL